MTLDPSEHTQQSDYLKRPDVQGHLKVMEMLREWDPLGVAPNNEPGAYDEYESYAPSIIKMLDRKATLDEMVDALGQLVLTHIGMPRFNEPHTRQLLTELQTWWESWKNTLE